MAQRYNNSQAFGADIANSFSGLGNAFMQAQMMAPRTALYGEQANVSRLNAQKLQNDIDYQRKQRTARDSFGSGYSGIANRMAELQRPQAQFPSDGSANMMPPSAGMTADDAATSVLRESSPALFQSGIEAGIDPQNISKALYGSLVRSGATDSTLAPLFTAAFGKAIGENDSFTLPGQDKIRAGNQANEMQKVNTQQAGDTFRNAATNRTTLAANTATNEAANWRFGQELVPVQTDNGGVVYTRRSAATGETPVLNETQARAQAFGRLPATAQAVAVGPSESQVNASTITGLPAADQRLAALGQAALADPAAARARTRAQEIGQSEGKLVDAWGADADKATKMLGSIEQIEKRIDAGASTGYGAEAKMQIGNALEAVGVPAALTNNLFGTTDRAVIQKNSADMVIAAIGSLGTGVSNADRDFIERVVPTLATPQEASKAILGYMRERANMQIDKYKQGVTAVNNGVNPLDFNMQWTTQRGEQLNVPRQGAAQAAPAPAQAPQETKAMGGKQYVKINGQWFEQ